MALQLEGKSEADAFTEVAQRLRSDLEQDGIPDRPADELFASAYRNYVVAAADLYTLNHESDAAKFGSFAGGIFDVVSFAVVAAASARAVEAPSA